MYSKSRYGINFIIDARVELIFGMLSKLKRDYSILNINDSIDYEEELDYIEVVNSKYANDFYELLDFNKYPKLLEWAIALAEVEECNLIPYITMMISEDFTEYEDVTNIKHYNDFFDKYNYKDFIEDINYFVNEERYIDFYKDDYLEYDKMISQSIKWYPSNFDIRDIEKWYGIGIDSYIVIYCVFFNGGFGPIINGIPICFKGLMIEDSEYIESTSYLINLFHEYSHPFINSLVDKYWDRFENSNNFLLYSIDNGLSDTYSDNVKTLYYEYLVRAISYIMSSKYEDSSRYIDRFKKIGFVKIEEIIDYIDNNYIVGKVFEEFFVDRLIPFMNRLTSSL